MESWKKNIDSGGYLALLAVIIVSMVLLTIAVAANVNGYFTRFNILEAQEKLQSNALAESCVNLAMSRLTENVSYPYSSGGTLPEIVNLGPDNCQIKNIATIGTEKQINTVANFQNTFTNFSVGTTVNSSSLSPTQAVVLVRVLVNNTHGGTKTPSDFVVSVDASEPSPSTFNGNSNGVAVYIDPGSFSASISSATPSNYSQPVGVNCSIASINAGDSSNTCTITIDDTPTTASLTVVANVINNNSGTKQPSDFVLRIDNVNQFSGISRTGLVPGDHTITATTMDGYSVSAWDAGCSGGSTANTINIDLDAGDSKTCYVTYDDNAPPAPACADTVMMLDRTGSMFGNSQDPINEGAAAASLLDLYSTVTPHPQVGIGSMGGLYVNGTNHASIPDGTNGQPLGQLTNIYGTKNSGFYSGPLAPSSQGSSNQWTNPSNIYANDSSYATDTTNGHQQAYKNFNLSVPSGAVISGIEVVLDAKDSTSPTNGGNLAATSTGNYNKWTANGSSNKVTDVNNSVINDANANYISETTQNDAQTFVFGNAGIPAGSTVNSVTISAYARSGSGSPTIKLRAEKGTGAGKQSDSASTAILGSSYAKYDYAMATNPFTGAAWAVSEVNGWTTRFGVVESSSTGTVRVTQIYVVVNYTPPDGSIGAALSSNNGSNWTTGAGLKTDSLSASETATTLGGSADTWNRAWASSDFSNANFQILLTNNSATGTAIYANYLTVKIYYSTPNTGLYKTIETMIAASSSGAGSYIDLDISAGDAELNSSRHDASQQKILIIISDGTPTDSKTTVTAAANAAKASGIKIFTIHFGSSTDAAFLASLSSGVGYSFDAPTSADMTSIFYDIGTLVCPALSYVPPPVPTQSALVIITNVDSGTALPSDFTTNISAANGTFSTSHSGTSAGYAIQVGPGAYSITEGLMSGYSESLGATCSGTIVGGATNTCVINNDILPSAPPPIPSIQNPPTITIDTWQENP